MIHYQRKLDLNALLAKKSIFLLGPRATGKSYLIHEQLHTKAVIIDLLRSDLHLRLSAAPWELESQLMAQIQTSERLWIVIDEVQKIPQLLDEVHRLIETRHWRFLLTGSSARKLKRGQANLLAGRAWTAHLYPLSISEIPNFDLDRYLHIGGLPMAYSSNDPQEELRAYAQTYLYEEIQAEGLVRKLPQFLRFLNTAALANGQLLNFAQIASNTGVPATTVKEYYSILEDTLIGFMLKPWQQAIKRKTIATAKFYLFDTGVCHALVGTQHLEPQTDLYGRSFEHWIAMELRCYLDYIRSHDVLSFWRDQQQHEVDFIIGNHTAIDVKASKKISDRELKNINILREENIIKKFYLVSQDSIERVHDNIICLHWKTFMERLWDHKIFL